MNDIVQEIWRSTLIPEGPMVVREALPADVKDKMYASLPPIWTRPTRTAPTAWPPARRWTSFR